MDGAAVGFGTLTLVLTILGVLLVICWIILPIAVIGTKPLLRQLLAEQRKTNELLEMRRTAGPQAVPDQQARRG